VVFIVPVLIFVVFLVLLVLHVVVDVVVICVTVAVVFLLLLNLLSLLFSPLLVLSFFGDDWLCLIVLAAFSTVVFVFVYGFVVRSCRGVC